MTFVTRILLGISLVLTGVLMAILLFVRLLHLQLLDVQTTSMEPTMHVRDLLVVKPVAISHIRIGQIITYRSNNNPRRLVSHRVITISSRLNILRTKGDALPYADPPIGAKRVVGRPVLVVPYGGTAIRFIKSPWGLSLFLYAPMAAILYHECRRLAKYYRGKTYRLVERAVL